MSMLRAAGGMSILTLLSRVLGFVRDVVMYGVFGASWVSGAFVLAWMIPNLLRRLFGEGALSAAFIPAFTRSLREDDTTASRSLLAGVLGGLTVALVAASIFVTIAALLIPASFWSLEPGNDPTGHANTETVGALFGELLAILFPYVLPVCLLAIGAGALNAYGRFAAPTAAPVLLNLLWIATLLAIGDRDAAQLPSAMRIVAWALLIGGFLQLSLVAIPLRRRGMLPTPIWPAAGHPARAVFAAMIPTALGMSVVQLNVLLDQAIATWLIGTEATNHIYLANRLLLFPHALVALPLATAVFPTLARHAGNSDLNAVAEQLGRAIHYTIALALPAAAGLVVLADELLAIGFVHGRYTEADAAITRWTTIALVAGLPAIGSSQLLARGFYAIGDMRTPARVAAWMVLVNISMNLVLVGGFDAGVAGLTAATSLSAWCNSVCLRSRLRRHGIRIVVGFAAVSRSVIATAAMVLAIVAIERVVPGGDSRLARALWQLVLPIVVGIGVWLLVQLWLGRDLLAVIRSRLRRKRG
jgi:putative peptidoglycan lipid II flippase